MTSKFNSLTFDLADPLLWRSVLNFIAIYAAAGPGIPADIMIQCNDRNRKSKLEGITEWAIRELGIHFNFVPAPGGAGGGQCFVYYVNFPHLTPDEIMQRFREEFDNAAVYAAGFWYLQRSTKNLFSKFNNMGI